VAAAVQLLYEHGIERTRLADIAHTADVPPGNVFYYFKTKDDLIAAVIEAHRQQTKAMLDSIEARHRSPKARLKALVHEFAEQSDTIAQHGCPLGGLAYDLDKRVESHDLPVADLMRTLIEWAEQQFRAAGHARQAHNLALDLIAAYEGTALLANTLDDPHILSAAARRLVRWIDDL
jgi:TetR/AcrR family transcriptional regulator, transcriptional repressor for nem operon